MNFHWQGDGRALWIWAPPHHKCCLEIHKLLPLMEEMRLPLCVLWTFPSLFNIFLSVFLLWTILSVDIWALTLLVLKQTFLSLDPKSATSWFHVSASQQNILEEWSLLSAFTSLPLTHSFLPVRLPCPPLHWNCSSWFISDLHVDNPMNDRYFSVLVSFGLSVAFSEFSFSWLHAVMCWQSGS